MTIDAALENTVVRIEPRWTAMAKPYHRQKSLTAA